MYPVSLHVYDLSQGMAKQFSPAFLGRQIDGIWHTGIVVYGKEYYYGGGILHDVPLRTPYGKPVEVHPLGSTEIPQEMFEEFLNGITGKFSMDKYHLLENNCNHFTNECSQFLLGKPIPNHISGLPAEVLNTPFGMMLKPMIDQFFSAQGWGAAMGPVSAQNPINSNLQNPLAGFGQNLLASLGGGQTTNPTGGQFTSPFSSLQSPNVVRSNIKNHPRHDIAHKHTKLVLPNVVHPEPVLFNQADNISTIYSKLFVFINEEKERVKLTQEEETKLKLSQNSLSNSQNTLPAVLQTIEKLIKNLTPEKVFPVLDILRILLLRSAPNSHYSNVQNPFIIDLIKTFTKDSTPRAAHLLTYRVAANMFSSAAGINYLLHTPEHLTTLVESIVGCLHANDKIMRKTVSNLCYNTCLFLDRRHSEEILQILSALVHLLSTSSISDDPDTDARQWLALGTLLFCNDEALETAQALEVDVTIETWISKISNNSNANVSKLRDVILEVKKLLQ